MNSNRTVLFDPWLLGAIQKAMGKLPAIPGDLAKVESLTFSDGGYLPGEEGLLLNGWLEIASGEFCAIGKMSNLHILFFKNSRILKIGNFDFLCQCQKLKRLDLSGTDFSDCELLAKLPNLRQSAYIQYSPFLRLAYEDLFCVICTSYLSPAPNYAGTELLWRFLSCQK